MINVKELRLGNYLMQKTGSRVETVVCDYRHFELVARGGARDLYPILLKAELLEQCGFTENKSYALLPDAHEYSLTLAVPGSNINQLMAYVKNNKECFGRAVVNGLAASHNFYQLHQLQNIYFALTGLELIPVFR